jgi:hypothetical protein
VTDRLFYALITGSAAAITGALYVSGEIHHWCHVYRRWRKDRGRKGLVNG